MQGDNEIEFTGGTRLPIPYEGPDKEIRLTFEGCAQDVGEVSMLVIGTAPHVFSEVIATANLQTRVPLRVGDNMTIDFTPNILLGDALNDK